jgi:hypothetical protein
MRFHCPATDLQLICYLLIGLTHSDELNYLNLGEYLEVWASRASIYGYSVNSTDDGIE